MTLWSGPVGAGEDGEVAETVDDVGGLRGGGGAGFAVENEIEAEEEAGAADVADDWELLLEGLEGLL